MTTIDTRPRDAQLVLPRDSGVDIRVDVIDAAGTPADLTVLGTTLALVISTQTGPVLTFSVDATAAALGRIVFSATVPQIQAVPPDLYRWSLRDTAHDVDWIVGGATISQSGQASTSQTITVSLSGQSLTLAITPGAAGGPYQPAFVAPGVPQANVIVLAAGDPLPPGVPADTVVIRT